VRSPIRQLRREVRRSRMEGPARPYGTATARNPERIRCRASGDVNVAVRPRWLEGVAPCDNGVVAGLRPGPLPASGGDGIAGANHSVHRCEGRRIPVQDALRGVHPRSAAKRVGREVLVEELGDEPPEVVAVAERGSAASPEGGSPLEKKRRGLRGYSPRQRVPL
jgi:hypothetical protein